jgi:glycosyltransferase involved in cell wall biosynthesis
LVEYYLGLPVAYHGVYLRRDLANNIQKKTRLWHLDLEDRKMLKIIIYLHEVCEEAGPLQYISKGLTPWIFHQLKYSYGKISDQKIQAIISSTNWKSCLGKAGTVIFIDPASVFHRGKVPIKSDRFSIFFDYTSRVPKYPYFCKYCCGINELIQLSQPLGQKAKNCIFWNFKVNQKYYQNNHLYQSNKTMKILFLDQSGKLGGAELSLLDLAKFYQQNALVGLFADGSFRQRLEQYQIPVEVLTQQSININKDSNFIQGLSSSFSLVPLLVNIIKLAQNYDLIYANTQKAFVMGAIASFLSHRPLVYHLRDIISEDHFSRTNRRIITTLANQFATLVIANSQATQHSFIEAGGRPELTEVVYNGFDVNCYSQRPAKRQSIRKELGLEKQFVMGHFSRLSPWKGQHILLEALAHCPDNISAIFVGDALFGEEEYVAQLHQQVAKLRLEKRVQFLGFQSDVVALMNACDLITHTSTAPEPFGRVIIEAMLCQRPVIAAAAGGVIELVKDGKTGWLVEPGNVQQLTQAIINCWQNPQLVTQVAQQAQQDASERFQLNRIQQQIDQLLHQVL